MAIKNPTNLSNQQAFRSRLDELFDIAHRDALSIIKIKEDRLFLEAQREKGHRGMFGGVDRSLSLKNEHVRKRKAAAANYELKSLASAPVLVDDDESDDELSSEMKSYTNSHSSTILSEPAAGPSKPKFQKMTRTPRGTVDVVTAEVAAALDRTNTSDRKAAHILSAIASTGNLQQDVEELVISCSAIRRARLKHRELFAPEIKTSFDPAVPLVLHWNGKIMEDFTDPGRNQADCLLILVSGQDVVKLLSVPKLHDGTANTMKCAVLDCIDEWGLHNRIKGLCFDTRASNTESKGGVCILLNLACRHHISEIMLEKVFSINDVSKSPNMEIFGHFREFWTRIDQASFSTSKDEESMKAIVTPWKDNVIEFARNQLERSAKRRLPQTS